MSSYSIAQAQDQLSRLVDEVLEGKEVTITRYGKPVVDLKAAASQLTPVNTTPAMLEKLKQFRESMPKLDVNSVDEIRAMRDEF